MTRGRWFAVGAGAAFAVSFASVALAFNPCFGFLDQIFGDTFSCPSIGGVSIDKALAEAVMGVLSILWGFAGDVMRFFYGGVMDWLLSVLPDAGPIGAPSMSGLLYGYAWANGFLPIDAGVAVAAMLMSMQVVRFTFQMGHFIWKTIPKPFMGT